MFCLLNTISSPTKCCPWVCMVCRAYRECFVLLNLVRTRARERFLKPLCLPPPPLSNPLASTLRCRVFLEHFPHSFIPPEAKGQLSQGSKDARGRRQMSQWSLRRVSDPGEGCRRQEKSSGPRRPGEMMGERAGGRAAAGPDRRGRSAEGGANCQLQPSACQRGPGRGAG